MLSYARHLLVSTKRLPHILQGVSGRVCVIEDWGLFTHFISFKVTKEIGEEH